MEYFAGLDVSLRCCTICVVDAQGKVKLERELPCEVSDIAEYLNSFGHWIERIGFEAGTLSQHLFYGLTGEGFDVVCMDARRWLPPPVWVYFLHSEIQPLSNSHHLRDKTKKIPLDIDQIHIKY